jgi:hypothetical protein
LLFHWKRNFRGRNASANGFAPTSGRSGEFDHRLHPSRNGYRGHGRLEWVYKITAHTNLRSHQKPQSSPKPMMGQQKRSELLQEEATGQDDYRPRTSY